MNADEPDGERAYVGLEDARVLDWLRQEVAELSEAAEEDYDYLASRILEELDRRMPEKSRTRSGVRRWLRSMALPEDAAASVLRELVLQGEVSRALQQREANERSTAAEDATRAPEDAWSAMTLHRSLPVRIYLGRNEAAERVEAALREVMQAFDMHVAKALPPIQGSWYRGIVARTGRGHTSAEMTELLAKVERALEMPVLHRPQADIDAAQGDAVAKLITSLDATPTAIIQMGSVLLVKVDGVLMVRNLTQTELSHLEGNPGIFTDPEAVLYELQRLARGLEGASDARHISPDKPPDSTLDLWPVSIGDGSRLPVAAVRQHVLKRVIKILYSLVPARQRLVEASFWGAWGYLLEDHGEPVWLSGLIDGWLSEWYRQGVIDDCLEQAAAY